MYLTVLELKKSEFATTFGALGKLAVAAKRTVIIESVVGQSYTIVSAGSTVVETELAAVVEPVKMVLTVTVAIKQDISTAVIVLMVITMFTVVRQSVDVPKFKFLGTFKRFDQLCTTIQEKITVAKQARQAAECTAESVEPSLLTGRQVEPVHRKLVAVVLMC